MTSAWERRKYVVVRAAILLSLPRREEGSHRRQLQKLAASHSPAICHDTASFARMTRSRLSPVIFRMSASE